MRNEIPVAVFEDGRGTLWIGICAGWRSAECRGANFSGARGRTVRPDVQDRGNGCKRDDGGASLASAYLDRRYTGSQQADRNDYRGGRAFRIFATESGKIFLVGSEARIYFRGVRATRAVFDG